MEDAANTVVPVLIGDRQRAQVVAGLIGQLDLELFRLEAEQVKRAAVDGDPFDPQCPVAPDGTVLSFEVERVELEAARERLVERYGGLLVPLEPSRNGSDGE